MSSVARSDVSGLKAGLSDGVIGQGNVVIWVHGDTLWMIALRPFQQKPY
jgi:hypothetical protein